ncbi:MAG TPA: hypothetical protein VK191_16445 [Symbiobacteriaceae bacterium]|nr:hypothetical protein [Symbiobacteriaceae bacterium]
MPLDPDDLVDIEEMRLLRYDPVVCQNGRNQLYFNPRALSAFVSTVEMPTIAIGFKWLSAVELALYFVKPNPPRTIPFRFSDSKRTGSFPFTPFLIERPILRASAGKQNQYAYRVDTLDDGTKQFVLLLSNPLVEPVVERQRRGAKKGTKRR